MINAVRKSGLDYVCLGNHEFDLGFGNLSAKMGKFNGKCLNSNGRQTPDLGWLPEYDLIKVVSLLQYNIPSTYLSGKTRN